MLYFRRLIVAAVIVFGATAPAAAQRYTFERSFDTSATVTLDAVTQRGKITVTTGSENRVIVRGTVTVRFGLDVPLDAVEIAQRLAASPPVDHKGDHVQLRPPGEEVDRRAVTIAYDVTVPVGTRVSAVSDSGALSIRGVRGPVTARTQSGALAFVNLKGAADITTGSGAVDLDGADGDVAITTQSSAITAHALRGDLRVKTGSGAVSVESRGPGNIEIATSSSAMTVTGAAGGLRVTTQSGRIEVAGRPTAPWMLTTGSSAIRVTFDAGSNALLDADTGSGSIRLANLQVAGTQAKQQVKGAIGSGGPAVTMTSRSGSFEIRGR
jgi:hypothetical protein